jgi:hypothetical protein
VVHLAVDRITAIRRSLTTFVCGISSFLPVLGVIPAVCAIGQWWLVHSRFGDQWNPASAYLRVGFVLALLGLLSSMVLVFVLAVAISNKYLFD